MDKESDIPPPGHPMHDILRMVGVIPPSPNLPNRMLERLIEEGKITREGAAARTVSSATTSSNWKIGDTHLSQRDKRTLAT